MFRVKDYFTMIAYLKKNKMQVASLLNKIKVQKKYTHA